MPDLTLAQRFGNNVSFDSASKMLTIDLNDLSSIIINGVDIGLDISAITAENQNSYATRILWALMLLNQANQPEDNTDETVGIYIQNQGKRNVIRNQVSQFGFTLAATAYKNDTVGVQLDPDAIGA